MRIFVFIMILLGSCMHLAAPTIWAECSLNDSGEAADYLKDCYNLSTSPVVDPQGATSVDGMKELVSKVAKRVIEFGSLFAIGAIVFAGIRYTTSYGDDEKTKHAKTTAIYAIIGLFLLLLSYPLVGTIVQFIYDLGS